MLDSKQILVLPGWYPGVLQPFNGDFIREQVNLLRSQGFRMDLVYCDFNIAYLRQFNFFRTKTLHCDRSGNSDIIYSGPFWPKNNNWGLNKFIRAFSRCIIDQFDTSGLPDIIHAHTYLGGLVAKQINEKHNIPYIITEHYTGWIDGSIPGFHRKKGLEAFEHAALVTAVSPFLQQKLSSLTSTSVINTPNFIDTSLFSKGNALQHAKKTSLICVGDLIPRKQMDLALKAFGQLGPVLNNLSLKIVGSGPEGKRLQALVTQLDIEGRVHFAGQKSKYDLAVMLQNADVLLHPSKLETFGLVIAEALCSGLSVITFDNGGTSAFEGLPGIHLCKEMSEDSMKNELLHLLSEAPNLSKLSISEAAQTRFGVRRNAELLNKQYEALLV